jgi:hypothetical protein
MTWTAKIGRCAIYKKDLERIWPFNDEECEGKKAEFVGEYGFPF